MMSGTKQNWMMVALLAIPLAGSSIAQQYPPQQPQQYPNAQEGQYAPQQQYPAYNQPLANYSPEQLDQMVSRIALYPDPLLAAVFAAATFPDQIQPAFQWSDQHHYLTGQNLANAIQNDQLGFDSSVVELLPFPSVLQMLASDVNWTASLGNAFMSQGPLLQDAVQRMRRRASDNGYLRSNDQIVVNNNGPWTEIAPLNPGYIVVPYYDPAVVYYRPWRPGFGVGVSFGYGVSIGGFFDPWGWGGNRFAWDRHETYIDNRVWDRRGDDRRGYDRRGDDRRGDDRRVEDRRGGDNRVNDSRPQNGGYEASRPVVRPDQRGVYEPRQAPSLRPDGGRGPERGAAAVARPDAHVLQGRNNNERRAADVGRPAPREVHGREQRQEPQQRRRN